jgi:mycothiol system anti-sigma-R factor
MKALAMASSPCRALAPALDTYLDGEMSPSQIIEVEAHLAQCPPCRERVALDRATRISLRREATLKAPESLRDRLQKKMAAEREARRASEQAEQAAKDQAPSAPIKLDPNRLMVGASELAANEILTTPQTSSTCALSNVVPFRRPERRLSALGTTCAPVEMLGEVEARPTARDEQIITSDSHRASRPLRARYALPFAVAAGVAFAISARQAPSTLPSATTQAKTPVVEASTVNASTVMGLDGLVEDMVSLHAQPLPPEVTQQDEVRKFDPFVGVPVEAPKLQTFGAKWLGGRVLPLRDSRAAMLQYTIAGGHRVTVYVYDPRRVKSSESRTLQPRMVRNSAVMVGNVRGYNVAATERKGVGYALATDLDEPESLELVTASAF